MCKMLVFAEAVCLGVYFAILITFLYIWKLFIKKSLIKNE